MSHSITPGLAKTLFFNTLLKSTLFHMPEHPSSDQLDLWKDKSPAATEQESLLPCFNLEKLSADRPTNAGKGTTPLKTSKLLDTSFALRRPLEILVADDNEINRKIIRIILQKLGYNCDEATNGKEALQQYNDGEYDYIFMDLDMPQMDGIQAARAIRKIEEESEPKAVEIVAVTANVSDKTRLQCRRAGMNGYLEKPITATLIKEQLIRSWPRIRSRRER